MDSSFLSTFLEWQMKLFVSNLSATVDIFVFRSLLVAVTVITQLPQAQRRSVPFELGQSPG